MLTNAHIVYCKINIDYFRQKKKDLILHLEFRQTILEYWINSDEFVKERKEKKDAFNNYLLKRKCDSSISSVTMDSIESDTKKFCNRHINDYSIAPDGRLKCRLDRYLDHLPTQRESPRAQYALHRWLGVDTSATLSLCKICGVHLCIKCYRYFHTEQNLLKHKQNLIRICKKKLITTNQVHQNKLYL